MTAAADVSIDAFLAGLGLNGADAARARAALEDAGLTNPRKQRISADKLERAREALAERLQLLCAACTLVATPDHRPQVRVEPRRLRALRRLEQCARRPRPGGRVRACGRAPSPVRRRLAVLPAGARPPRRRRPRAAARRRHRTRHEGRRAARDRLGGRRRRARRHGASPTRCRRSTRAIRRRARSSSSRAGAGSRRSRTTSPAATSWRDAPAEREPGSAPARGFPACAAIRRRRGHTPDPGVIRHALGPRHAPNGRGRIWQPPL